MKKTWRWFGKKDAITLSMLRQIGVEGIVTALHAIPNGEIWTLDAILDLKHYIENAGLEWSVVESLPVSESIKYGGADRDRLIDNYIVSLENLGKAGVTTVCYNFMPVIDWIRTDLRHPAPDGSTTLYFDKIRFACFDCFILQREGAEQSYSVEEMQQVRALNQVITQAEKDALIDTVIVKTQGFINGNISEADQQPVALFKQLMSRYDGIDKAALRENMRYFLQRIMPVCNRYDIKMCVHPDDPPFPVLGLPRIVGNAEDIAWLLNAVDDPHNGLTFCAGSLSAAIANNVPEMAARFASRTHFVHLRSTAVDSQGNFTEADHLQGRGHLIELVKIFDKQNAALPMRIDHGRLLSDDKDKNYNPGYSFLGRMYALAQIDGVMATIKSLSA
ncbi:MAG: mannonate dehydratase [Candidatus Symbiothrix sp.]|jgi:mannonate dehydratase|nr:mannonate dehydratase [Candidatus Symbiothrix sp.]